MTSRLRTTLIISTILVTLGAPVVVVFVGLLLYYRFHIPLHDLIPGILIVIDPLIIVLVLVETVALIYHGGRTQKYMKTTATAVDAIGSSVRLLERDKVYLRLQETTQNAKRYIHHLSFAQSTSATGSGEERKRVEQFLSALKSACRDLPHGSSKRADVKVLGPDWPEKVGGLWERQRQGCEVRVSAEVSNYDVRIQVIDDLTIVLGVGPLSRESERGFLIESYMLADVLNDRFMKLWDDEFTKPLELHTTNIVMSQVKAMLPKGELEEIIRIFLHVPTDEITQEIIRLLQSREHLTESDGVFYKKQLIRELHGQDLSDHELRIVLREMGTGLSDSSIEKFIQLVRQLDAADPVGYTSAKPPKGNQGSSKSKSKTDDKSKSGEASPEDEPQENS